MSKKLIKFLLAMVSTAAAVTAMHYIVLIPGAYEVLGLGLLCSGLCIGFYGMIDIYITNRRTHD